ncbi:LysR substrate-binding domain-containing protein [Streptomyces sp. NPDC097704]|uniref:LysR substrate-binding domain-containing protein n=1 Tax=Streptomyces sp. NPDC097704 TaxID=3157101 RepID=UPI00332BAD22
MIAALPYVTTPGSRTPNIRRRRTVARTRHPGISVEVRELPQDRIEAELLADRLDLGIAFHGEHLPGVEATELFTETLGLVVGPGHPFTDRTEPVRAEELNDHHLVLLSRDFATRLHIDAYVSEHRVRPVIAVEANSVTALTEIVRRTALATVLPDAVTQDHPWLSPVPLSPALPSRAVALLRRAAGYRSAAAGAPSPNWPRGGEGKPRVNRSDDPGVHRCGRRVQPGRRRPTAGYGTRMRSRAGRGFPTAPAVPRVHLEQIP